jgi:hypothetical protein
MEPQISELKQIATQLLAGMLANPHVYPTISDELARGQKEQDLIIAAIAMAESLITKIEKKTESTSF